MPSALGDAPTEHVRAREEAVDGPASRHNGLSKRFDNPTHCLAG
ncbi:hypothetical protein GCM10027605_24130 [Micromonospora zhanjiangensis]